MSLAPHPYLLRVRDWLRTSERGRWDWFASDEWTSDYADSVRLELLKSTYRMEPESHAKLYAIGARALSKLELDVPLTFYQAQDDGGMNAGLFFVPGEAHVVLRGRVLATLADDELAALVGHELAHHRLYTCEGGSLRVAHEVIEAIAAHPQAASSHCETALRVRRYSELYADRGSLLVTGDPHHVIGCLIKVHTGLGEIDPAAYLRQAEEILANKDVASKASTHPETFIRARAIALFHEGGAATEEEISRLVQGARAMDTLDVLDQEALTDTTRALLGGLLSSAWFRTDPVLAHACAFFPDARELVRAPSTCASFIPRFASISLMCCSTSPWSTNRWETQRSRTCCNFRRESASQSRSTASRATSSS